MQNQRDAGVGVGPLGGDSGGRGRELRRGAAWRAEGGPAQSRCAQCCQGRWSARVVPAEGEEPARGGGGWLGLTEFLRSRYLVFLVTGIPDRKARMSLLAWKTGALG